MGSITKLHLTDTRTKLFQLHKCSSVVQLNHPEQMTLKKRPIFFIHGAEYRDESEVMRDLVFPFFKSAHLSIAEGEALFDIIFVSWDSTLLGSNDNMTKGLRPSQRSRASRLFRLLRQWSCFFDDLEARADATARDLLPYVSRLLDGSTEAPFIVTHSLGAYVWSRLLTDYLRQHPHPPHLGTWWSLQPALPHNAFHHDGTFADLPALYKSLNGHHELWYSRFDCVLRFLYPVIKRHRALGQTGCMQKNFGLQFDLTASVGEAHGVFSMFPGQGDFMSRVSCFLRARMQWELGATALRQHA